MLKDLNIRSDNYNYIFDEKPMIVESNIDYIASIEEYYHEYGCIHESNVEDFLNYFITEVRKKIALPLDPVEFSYKGTCSRAQYILDDVFKKIGITSYGFNIGTMFLDSSMLHQLDIISIPVFDGNEIINKDYILDPTFRQFCIDEENRFERYFEEPRYAVKMSTPHPGYFLNMSEDKKAFANELIKKGYFEVTDKNIKTYFDSFALYLTPKEKYNSDELVGRISQTNNNAKDYVDLINKSIKEQVLTPRKSENLPTPKEIVNKKKGSFFNYISGKFKGNNNITVSNERSM